MAVTITHVKSQHSGSAFEHIVDITGPASYTTGGEVLTAGQAGQLMPRLGGGLTNADLLKVQLFMSERTSGGVSVSLDRVAGKVIFIAGGTEAGSGSNQSGVTVRARLTYGMVGD